LPEEVLLNLAAELVETGRADLHEVSRGWASLAQRVSRHGVHKPTG